MKNMLHSIIIDDEYDGRESLRFSLEKYCPEIYIDRLCETPEQGIEAIETLNPDLVFLDVQMPRMSGFDLLKQVIPFHFEVIFVSAYDKYAIKAIRFSALDYLLKPLDIDELIKAVQRARERMGGKNSSFQYQSVLNNIRYKERKIEKLAVPTFEGIDLFNTDDIIYCEADGSYTKMIMTNKQNKIVSRNLKDFELLLESSGFCRVHNSYLINLKHVVKYLKGEGGVAVLTGGFHVDIARRRKEDFINLLDKL